METVQSLGYFVPELILVGTLAVLLIAEAALKKNRALAAAWIAGAGAAMAALAALGDASKGAEAIFYGATAVDGMVVFFRVFFSAVAIAVVIFSSPHAGADGKIGRRGGEFYSLMTASLLGAYLLVGATDLVMIFIALEMVSIPSYIMAGYYREDRKGAEAAVKYVIYGAFASGAMFFGFSLLYGMTGHTNIYEIGRVLRTMPPSVGLLSAGILTLAGAGYKISMVPFHFWAPDVYEGAPTPAAAFFAVGPKAAGVAFLARLVWAFGAGPLSEPTGLWTFAGGLDWSQILAAFAAITMTLGNLAALSQENMKRLLAYSGVAHAGYILMGLAAFSGEGLQAVILYLMVYYFANLAFFLIVDMVEQKSGSVEMDAFTGLGWKNPALGVGMVMILVSLTGIPPSAGFVGKWYLFAALISQKMYWLAIIGVINSVISLWYYFRVAKSIWLSDAREGATPLTPPLTQGVLAAVLIIPILLLQFFPQGIFNLAGYAAGLL